LACMPACLADSVNSQVQPGRDLRRSQGKPCGTPTAHRMEDMGISTPSTHLFHVGGNPHNHIQERGGSHITCSIGRQRGCKVIKKSRESVWRQCRRKEAKAMHRGARMCVCARVCMCARRLKWLWRVVAMLGGRLRITTKLELKGGQRCSP